MLSHMLRVPVDSGGYPLLGSYIESDTGASASTTIAVTMPSGIVAGNMLLVVVSNATALNTWSTPAGWNLLTSGQSSAIFYRIATGSETSTYTFTTSGSALLTASAWCFTGSHGSSAPEVQATNSSTNTKNADPPSLTPSWGAAKNLWVTVYCSLSNASGVQITSYPANYTYFSYAIYRTTGSNGVQYVAGRKLNASTEDPGTYASSGNSGRYLVATIAIRPA